MLDLEKILKILIEYKVEFIIVGGFASIIHGASYVTKDLDICVNFSKENAHSLKYPQNQLRDKEKGTISKSKFLLSACIKTSNNPTSISECISLISESFHPRLPRYHPKSVSAPSSSSFFLKRFATSLLGKSNPLH